MRCRGSGVRRFVAVTAVALAAVSQPAHGQLADTTMSCDGRAVGSVTVETSRPQFRGPAAWWRKLARAVGLHHETTSEGLVRRFVSLDPGMVCTEFRRGESERVLRAQPYLADANVVTTRVGDSIHVNVRTVDEVPVVAAARLRGLSPQALSFGTMNFAGAGLHVEGRWENGRALRQGFGGKLSHQQLLGRPYAVVIEGQRRPLGETYATSLSHPFITDLQRIAWHAGHVVSKDFVSLRRPDRSQLVQPVDRSIWNVGGVVRIGPPRRLGLIGGMVLGERVVPHHRFAVVASSGRRITTTDTPRVPRYEIFEATNVAGLLGLRALTFSRMRGLDALVAEQDVATGTQVAATAGLRPFFDRPFRNAFTAVDVYVAGRSRRSFVASRVEAESRVDLERRDWRHLVASGRAAWYFRGTPRWVSELSVEGGGAWRPLMPLQLELGDRRTGVRGYARSYEAGGQRLLARIEQRIDFGRYQGTRAAFGAAAFADAGRIWRGEAPFGVTSPVRTSAGVALLAAMPARSQRTIRAEIAFPVAHASAARPELRFVIREPARGFWFEPPQLRWARLSSVPKQVFSWP
jgi:hypothetical protein